MQAKRTTGLSAKQFIDLCDRVKVHLGAWHPQTGRKRALSLNQAIKATVMYVKNNITQEVIGELLDVDQSTISRTIGQIEVLVTEVLEEFVPEVTGEAVGRVTIVDGSLCPCWSWTDAPQLYSGKHQTAGHSHQFVVSLDGQLLHISDPLPGSTHDAKAIKETGVLDLIDPTNCFGDKGYIGVGLVTPFRKPAKGELLDWQKEFNTFINERRWIVEREIANFKTWRIMHTDYRRPRHTYPTAFRAVRALHFFKLRFA